MPHFDFSLSLTSLLCHKQSIELPISPLSIVALITRFDKITCQSVTTSLEVLDQSCRMLIFALCKFLMESIYLLLIIQQLLVWLTKPGTKFTHWRKSNFSTSLQKISFSLLFILEIMHNYQPEAPTTRGGPTHFGVHTLYHTIDQTNFTMQLTKPNQTNLCACTEIIMFFHNTAYQRITFHREVSIGETSGTKFGFSHRWAGGRQSIWAVSA